MAASVHPSALTGRCDLTGASCPSVRLLDVLQLERDVMRMLPALSGILGQARLDQPIERRRNGRLDLGQPWRIALENHRNESRA